MRQKLLKEHAKILLSCLLIFIVCAFIQYISFSILFQKEKNNRNTVMIYYFNSYEEAMQRSEEVSMASEILVHNQVYYVDEPYYHNGEPQHWKLVYKYDFWGVNPPKLFDLLTNTINAPLIVVAAILMAILIVRQIEQDYTSNKSVLTILRLPRPRKLYLWSKLLYPLVLMFMFWGIQFLVILIQTNIYLNAVPEELRTENSSPWIFDYYRMLYPIVEPIWFPATVCALCIVPLATISIVFTAKGGMKSWVYSILPITGFAAIVLVISRVSFMWWTTPVLLVAIYFNCIILLNKGQIVQ